MKSSMKTLVLENDHYFYDGQEEFIKSIDPNYEKFNPSMKDKWDLYQVTAWFASLLSQPSLENVIIESSLENKAYGTSKNIDIDDEDDNQFEFLTKLMAPILRIRERLKLPILTFHIVYLGGDFMKSLQRGDMGKTSADTVEIILRQQNNICIKLYNEERKLIKILHGKAEE